MEPVPESDLHATLLRVLSAVNAGDFSCRMPVHWVGVNGKVADTLNEIIGANEALAAELERVSRVVGKEGRLADRVSFRGSGQVWGDGIASVNTLIDDLVRPSNEMQRVIGAVADGDLSKKVTADVQGEMLVLKNTRGSPRCVVPRMRAVGDGGCRNGHPWGQALSRLSAHDDQKAHMLTVTPHASFCGWEFDPDQGRLQGGGRTRSESVDSSEHSARAYLWSPPRPEAQPPLLASPSLLDGAATNVFELSDDLLGSARADGHFEALNPAWERVTGFTREELMAQPFIEFVHLEDRQATVAEAARVATTGSPTVFFENRYALRNGGWCWLSWKCQRKEDHLYFIARDVTERVVLDQRNNLLAKVVGGIDDAILTKTLDGVVTSWNRAAEDLYGYSAAEAVGRKMADLVVPENLQDEPRLIVEHLLRGEGVRQHSTHRHRKDGSELTVALTASLLRDVDHAAFGVAVISRDSAELSASDLCLSSEIDALMWVGRIREAIDEHRIVFHAQPIVSLAGGPESYELLCRMVGRDGSVILPSLFMPAAETYGLVQELDLLAVDEAVRQIRLGRAVSVNFSAATVGCWHIVDVVEEKLRGAGADPDRLTVEITETAAVKNLTEAQRFAADLTELGCHLSLDDFGTGFGGFTYLKQLRVDQLKIDTEFVGDLSSCPASRHVVQAVVSLAEGFGLDTVAEGVEDDETLRLLKDLGVTHAQGYHLGRPQPFADPVLLVEPR